MLLSSLPRRNLEFEVPHEDHQYRDLYRRRRLAPVDLRQDRDGRGRDRVWRMQRRTFASRRRWHHRGPDASAHRQGPGRLRDAVLGYVSGHETEPRGHRGQGYRRAGLRLDRHQGQGPRHLGDGALRGTHERRGTPILVPLRHIPSAPLGHPRHTADKDDGGHLEPGSRGRGTGVYGTEDQHRGAGRAGVGRVRRVRRRPRHH